MRDPNSHLPQIASLQLLYWPNLLVKCSLKVDEKHPGSPVSSLPSPYFQRTGAPKDLAYQWGILGVILLTIRTSVGPAESRLARPLVLKEGWLLSEKEVGFLTDSSTTPQELINSASWWAPSKLGRPGSGCISPPDAHLGWQALHIPTWRNDISIHRPV